MISLERARQNTEFAVDKNIGEIMDAISEGIYKESMNGLTKIFVKVPSLAFAKRAEDELNKLGYKAWWNTSNDEIEMVISWA